MVFHAKRVGEENELRLTCVITLPVAVCQSIDVVGGGKGGTFKSPSSWRCSGEKVVILSKGLSLIIGQDLRGVKID